MKIFKLSLFALASVLALPVFSPLSQAESIATFTSSVSTAGAVAQLGRLSRNNVQQDWTGMETYPGEINTGTTYYYHAYTFSSSLFTGAPYVDISIFDEANLGNFFVSAYANSYDPTHKSTNWLGDAGASGNYFGTDPRYFDVILPVGSSLVLVVNTTPGGTAGSTSLYDIAINAYADTDYDDPAAPTTPSPVPEPSTLVTLGTGVAGLAEAVRRKAWKK